MRTLFLNPVVGGAVLSLASMGAAFAQNTGAVSGADVKEGDRAVEARSAYSPDHDGREEGYAHRLHYQYAFDGRWRVRGVLALGRRGGEPLKARGVAVEIMRQVVESERSGGWDSAVRIDGLIPIEKAPGRARVAWLNQVDLGSGVEARGNIYFSHAIGDNAADGVAIETREEATLAVSPTLRLGAQMFNNFNTTAHFGSFDQQRHQAGPVAKLKLGDHWKIEASALFGVSAAASDADFRLFVGYGF